MTNRLIDWMMLSKWDIENVVDGSAIVKNAAVFTVLLARNMPTPFHGQDSLGLQKVVILCWEKILPRSKDI